MKLPRDDEVVTGTFSNPSADRYPAQPVNVSATDVSMLRPRDDRGVRVSIEPPGWGTKQNRTPELRDSTTGLLLAAQDMAALRRAAANPHVLYEVSSHPVADDAYPSPGAYLDPAAVQAMKTEAHHAAVEGADGLHIPGGFVGGSSLLVGSPAASMRWLFGIGGR